MNISKRQVFALLVLEMTGAGFVIIPKLALTLAWVDGLTSIIMATAIACFYCIGILKLSELYEGKALFDICDCVLGTFPTAILRCGFVIKSTLFCGLCLGILAHSITRVIEGELSPLWVMITFILLVFYGCIKGREVRGRMGEVFLIPFLAVLLLVIMVGLRDTEGFKELLPLLTEDGGNIITGGVSVFMWFYPLEYVLVSMPYINNSDNLDKVCCKAVLLSGGVIALVFTMTLMRFGASQMAGLDYPVLEMMYTVSLPFSFLERLEGFMLGIWLVGMFFTLNGGLYHSGVCVSELLKGTSLNIAFFMLALGSVAVALITKDISRITSYLISFMLLSESIYLIVLPLVLCLRGLWEDRKNEDFN